MSLPSTVSENLPTATPANTAATGPRRLSPRLIAGLFALLFGALALGYLLFLRADYVPAFSELRPADAAAVVAQLEAKKIGYRLADGGGTIMVPADQLDTARLAIAGSDVALKGGVGFELFNKSDMGLTDFAQRINYQRALQGELERSIMMIDEVESARVHLAMPERTIFRSERSAAKAAVEVVVKPGRSFDAARVMGVQRLVAFAVPDLAANDVVVLDGAGRIMGATASEDPYLTPGAEERRGMQGYYRARARAALAGALPGIETDVHVMTLGDVVTADGGDAAIASGPSDPGPAHDADATRAARPVRNFRLRLVVATAAPLTAEETAIARDAVAAAVALDPAAGDTLTFQVGVVADDPAAAQQTGAAATEMSSRPREAEVAPETAATPIGAAVPWAFWIVGGVLLLIAGGLLLPRIGPRGRLDAQEREAMIERIRMALRQEEASHADA